MRRLEIFCAILILLSSVVIKILPSVNADSVAAPEIIPIMDEIKSIFGDIHGVSASLKQCGGSNSPKFDFVKLEE